MEGVIEKLQIALEDLKKIEIKDMCENQKSTLEKALVMLRVEWEKNNATNLICSGYKTNIPLWDWSEKIYTISKKTVPLDFTDSDKLLGAKIIDKRDNSKHIITNVLFNVVRCGGFRFNYTELYDYCTFADGSPISKDVEG